jgi:hypothetical protein
LIFLLLIFSEQNLELVGMLRGLSPPHAICQELYILAGFFRDPLQRRQQAERMHASRVIDDCPLVNDLCNLDPIINRLLGFVIGASKSGSSTRTKKWEMMANNQEKWTLWHRALREQVVQIVEIFTIYIL